MLRVRERERNGGENVETERREINGGRIWAALGLELEWALIAGRLPERTDNQVKNYWNAHLSKKLGIKKGKSNETRTNSTNLRRTREEY
ncbi:hypothetical protein TIFTF001_047954 [Ficus carica]|uniref:Uncharacterized protein n=1 Tax=Ficus carica TaxID=3494 RepID=A0AA87Z591_FICCA|nr:hypothetical protein TIFTF001_047954 [Ficus carica]